MAWTLTYQSLPDGTPIEHTLIWWGISEPVRTHAHAAGDSYTFTVVDEVAHEAAPLLDPGPTGVEHRVWLTKDGVVKFVGLIDGAPQRSDGDTEQKSFTVLGIGCLLERTVFHQDRTAGLYPSTVLGPLIDSQVWLGRTALGAYQTTGAQIAEVLTYAAQQALLDGHTFQHDATGFPAVNILLDECHGITCQQAILRMLAHSPDYSAWWDYSTLGLDGRPKPTYRIRSRAAMTAREIRRADGHLSVSPQWGKLIRVVAITYSITQQVDGQSRVILRRDIHPATLNGNPTTGRELGALAVTIPLRGSSVQNLSSSIVCADINAAHAADGLRVEWWLQHHAAVRANGNLAAGLVYDENGWAVVVVEEGVEYFFEKAGDSALVVDGSTSLSASGYFTATSTSVVLQGGVEGRPVTAYVGRITIPADSVVRYGLHGYPRRLQPGSGGLAPWMGFSAEQERVTARAFVVDKTGGHYVDLAVELTATNAVSGNYATNALLEEGEPVPSGLAAALHGSVSVLQWQGTYQLTAQESADWLSLGFVYNVPDAEPALASARLMLWRVTVDEFMGTTVAEFGFPEHLTVGDMVAHLQAYRLRNLQTLPSVQNTGLASGTEAANLPTVNPRNDASAKTHEREELKMSSPTPGMTQRMHAALSQLPADSLARWRETFGSNVVDGVCTLQRCYVLRTDWENV